MKKAQKSSVPKDLQALGERFENWRKSKTGQSDPIPEKLWRRAVVLAKRHSPTQIARYLRLSSVDLKVHMGGKTARRPGGTGAAGKQAPQVIRLAPLVVPPGPAAVKGAAIEIENKAGGKLRLDPAAVDVGAVIQAFLEGAR